MPFSLAKRQADWSGIVSVTHCKCFSYPAALQLNVFTLLSQCRSVKQEQCSPVALSNGGNFQLSWHFCYHTLVLFTMNYPVCLCGKVRTYTTQRRWYSLALKCMLQSTWPFLKGKVKCCHHMKKDMKTLQAKTWSISFHGLQPTTSDTWSKCIHISDEVGPCP